MNVKNGLVQVLGLLLLGLLIALSTPYLAKHLSSSIGQQVRQALAQSGQQWAGIEVDGRDVRIGGTAPDTDAYNTTLDTLEDIALVREVDNQITNRAVLPYTFTLSWDSDKLIVDGFLANQDAYQHFLKQARKIFGADAVSGQVQLASGEPQNWNRALETTLQQVRQMKAAYVQISDHNIYVSGQVDTTHGRNRIAKAMNALKQDAYTASLHIQPKDSAQLVCQQRFDALLAQNTINFASGSAKIPPSSHTLLDSLTKTASLCPDRPISIAGHTDNAGEEAANLKLSRQRAEAVANYLFQQGVPQERLQAVGYGESKPVADNATPEGQEKNRRIEFIVGGQ